MRGRKSEEPQPSVTPGRSAQLLNVKGTLNPSGNSNHHFRTPLIICASHQNPNYDFKAQVTPSSFPYCWKVRPRRRQLQVREGLRTGRHHLPRRPWAWAQHTSKTPAPHWFELNPFAPTSPPAQEKVPPLLDFIRGNFLISSSSYA